MYTTHLVYNAYFFQDFWCMFRARRRRRRQEHLIAVFQIWTCELNAHHNEDHPVITGLAADEC